MNKKAPSLPPGEKALTSTDLSLITARYFRSGFIIASGYSGLVLLASAKNISGLSNSALKAKAQIYRHGDKRGY